MYASAAWTHAPRSLLMLRLPADGACSLSSSAQCAWQMRTARRAPPTPTVPTSRRRAPSAIHSCSWPEAAAAARGCPPTASPPAARLPTASTPPVGTRRAIRLVHIATGATCSPRAQPSARGCHRRFCRRRHRRRRHRHRRHRRRQRRSPGCRAPPTRPTSSSTRLPKAACQATRHAQTCFPTGPTRN